MDYLHEYAKPFFFEGNNEGCLLIHGFTATPSQMRLLGEYLHKQGYTVKGILLKGHGTSLQEMEKSTWQDWLQNVIDAYEALHQQCSKVYVIGLSMGGVLSLLLAENYPVDKIVPIASPIRIYDRMARYTPLLKYFRRFSYWQENTPSKDGVKNKMQCQDEKEYSIGYSGTPVRRVPDLLKLMKKAEKKLSSITCPTLIIQSRMDKTVVPDSAQIIYDGISSSQKEILWLDHSKHVCTLGPEKEIIHNKITAFLKNT